MSNQGPGVLFKRPAPAAVHGWVLNPAPVVFDRIVLADTAEAARQSASEHVQIRDICILSIGRVRWKTESGNYPEMAKLKYLWH